MLENFEKSNLTIYEFLRDKPKIKDYTFSKYYRLYRNNKENFISNVAIGKLEKATIDIEMDINSLYKSSISISQKGYAKLKRDLENIKKQQDKKMFEEMKEDNYFI